jgi:hypothetical protein
MSVRYSDVIDGWSIVALWQFYKKKPQPLSHPRRRFHFARKSVRALVDDTLLLLLVRITAMRPAPAVPLVTGAGHLAGEAPPSLRWVQGVRDETSTY